MNRREFIGGAVAAAGTLAGCKTYAFGEGPMNGLLLHFGVNMWQDGRKTTKMCFDYEVWKAVTERMANKGLNYVLIDLGEGLRYPSHPELAVEGSWTPERMQEEMRRLRSLGLEPLPKLNFSAGHNAWMGDYRRMCGTKKYYEVISDLVKDVAEVFEHPRLFHFGYDEEKFANQKRFDICIVRQGEMWWRDLFGLVKEIEKHGMRPWMFSDYGWHNPDFVQKCPKSVLQMNWYYDDVMFGFDYSKVRKTHWVYNAIKLFEDMDKAGFDQTPCGSNWVSRDRKEAGKKNDECMAGIVECAKRYISPAHNLGYCMAPWEYCIAKSRDYLFDSVDQLAAAIS